MRCRVHRRITFTASSTSPIRKIAQGEADRSLADALRRKQPSPNNQPFTVGDVDVDVLHEPRRQESFSIAKARFGRQRPSCVTCSAVRCLTRCPREQEPAGKGVRNGSRSQAKAGVPPSAIEEVARLPWLREVSDGPVKCEKRVAVRRSTIELDPEISTAAAFQTIALSCLDPAAANERAIREGNTNGIHQMRVSASAKSGNTGIHGITTRPRNRVGQDGT
jgi:hypothetical protein